MKKVLFALVWMGFITGTAHADWILYITTFPIPSCPSIACGHVTPTESYSSLESCKKVVDQLVDQFRAGTNGRNDLIYARLSKNTLERAFLVPGIWTAWAFHHPAIAWPIDRVFRIPLVIAWRPERTALLTAWPRAAMRVLIGGIAQAEALVLDLAPPAPSKRQKRRLTTNPLLTTRRFDQRRCGIATEAPRLAGSRGGFQAVG
jgi:hypothetical protein